MKIKIKKGFTLAETLVTLTILGLVAALTIPGIIRHYKKIVTEVKLKAIYSQLSNIVEQMNVVDGFLPKLVDDEFLGRTKNNAANYFAETYLKKYLKYTDTCEVTKSTASCGFFVKLTPYDGVSNDNNGLLISQMYRFKLNNGMYLGLVWIGSNTFALVVDINGKSGPNKVGHDIFYFALHGMPTSSSLVEQNDVDCGRMEHYIDSYYVNYSWIRNECKGNGMACTCPIMKNNFKIPNDYPVKF